MVVAVALAACSRPGLGVAPSGPSGSPVVTIEAGLTPRMTPEEVEAVAIQQIHLMEGMVVAAVQPPKILAITATTASGVETLEPGSGHQAPPVPGIQWLVRAEGTFTNDRGPSGASQAIAPTGYFVIDDADGGVIGYGFP
jgi:hypothetical protein